MNLFKKIGKSIAIAFSMYSKIPMVQFEWKEEDMRYSMCFFPLVGIVIGLLSWCWWLFCQQFGIGKMCFAFVGLAIILLVIWMAIWIRWMRFILMEAARKSWKS